MKSILLNDLAATRRVRNFFRTVLVLPFVVLLLTYVLPAQDNKALKIPGGETEKRQGYSGFEPGFVVIDGQTAKEIPFGLVLVVDGNSDPHGWYFTPPAFEDHLLEGQWTDDGMVLDGQNGERLSLKYMREHSSAKPDEPLSLYVITTLTGTLLSPSGEQQVTLHIDFSRGPLKNGRWYDFGASDAEVEKNAQAFLRAVEEGDARAAALHIDFPLTTFLEKKTVKIRNAQEFLRLYNRILPPQTSGRAKMALPHDMFCRLDRAMVLNGGVWFSAKGAVSEWLSPMSGRHVSN